MKLVFSGLVDTKTRNQLVVKSVHSSGSLNSFFSVFVILMWIKEGALKNVFLIDVALKNNSNSSNGS